MRTLLVMLSLMLGHIAHADEFTVGGITYSTSDEYWDYEQETGVALLHCNVIGYTDELPADVVIPAVVEYNGTEYPVKEVAENAFNGCTTIESVTCSENIVKIGCGAFSGCNNLNTVNLNEGLQCMEWWTFDGCPFETVNVPSTIIKMDGEVFGRCHGLKKITMNSAPPSDTYDLTSGCNPADISIVVPDKYATAYATAEWTNYGKLISATTGEEFSFVQQEMEVYGNVLVNGVSREGWFTAWSIEGTDIELTFSMPKGYENSFVLYIDYEDVTSQIVDGKYLLPVGEFHSVNAVLQYASIRNIGGYTVYINDNALSYSYSSYSSVPVNGIISLNQDDMPQDYGWSLFVDGKDVTDQLDQNLQYAFSLANGTYCDVEVRENRSYIRYLSYEGYSLIVTGGEGEDAFEYEIYPYYVEVPFKQDVTISVKDFPEEYSFNLYVNDVDVTADLDENRNYTFKPGAGYNSIYISTSQTYITNYSQNARVSVGDVTIGTGESHSFYTAGSAVITVDESEEYSYQLFVNGEDVTENMVGNTYTIATELNQTYDITTQKARIKVVFADRYRTFNHNEALVFADDDPVKAWIVSGYKNGNTILTRVSVVPANTGVLLEAEEGTVYELKTTTETAYYSNLLQPTTYGRVDSEVWLWDNRKGGNYLYYNYLLGKKPYKFLLARIILLQKA